MSNIQEEAMSMIDKLAQIREMQGRPPIDGQRSPFAPGEAPPVTLPPGFRPGDKEAFDLPDDVWSEDLESGEGDAPTEPEQGRTAAPPSPLIPRNAAAFGPPVAPPPTVAPIAPPDLVVLSNDGHPCIARYKEHQVELAPKDRQAIELIVKRAIVRKVQELLPVRVRRSKRSGADVPAAGGAEPSAAPRRRVRRKA